MEKLDLQDFIRYVLGAGVGALALALAYSDRVEEKFASLSAPQATLLGLILLVFGTALYGLHRALLHPTLLRVLVLWPIVLARRNTKRGGMLNPFKPTELELVLIRKRWCNGPPTGAKTWASQVHSLYCSAWAILALWAFAPCYWGQPKTSGWFHWLFFLTLGGAVLEDLRLSYSVIVEEIEQGDQVVGERAVEAGASRDLRGR